jgi:hypothetical protein
MCGQMSLAFCKRFHVAARSLAGTGHVAVPQSCIYAIPKMCTHKESKHVYTPRFCVYTSVLCIRNSQDVYTQEVHTPSLVLLNLCIHESRTKLLYTNLFFVEVVHEKEAMYTKKRPCTRKRGRIHEKEAVYTKKRPYTPN